MCGGTTRQRRGSLYAAGLSPRVRGNPALDDLGCGRPGSIPACAGEPRADLPAGSDPTVYPRVCGGTVSRDRTWSPAWGLSPRVRGNHSDLRRAVHAQGSIPACAGEPMVVSPSTAVVRVYPRVCGGTESRPVGDRLRCGLSPRVRGNPVRDTALSEEQRSIPACAGEPRTSRRPSHRSGVYPRVCGGTAKVRPLAQEIRGLSPRVRGNPIVRPVAGRILGSIPACAGEPR